MSLNNTPWTRLIRNIMTSGPFVLLLALQGITGIDPAWGTTLQFEDQKIEVTDGFASYPIAIDEDVALVGTQMHRGPDKDAVYVFRKVGDQWVQEQKLEPWDENIGIKFMNASYRPLAIDGNVAMVSSNSVAAGNTQSAGTVYIFRWNGTSWAKEQKLTLTDSDPNIFAVAVRGDLAVFGSCKGRYQDSIGTVHIFRRIDGIWTEEQMLLPSDSKLGDFFGREIAISDDSEMVVVGSGYFGAWDFVLPAVYVFRRENGTWIETQRLTSSLEIPAGHSVALSGDWLFASCPMGLTYIGSVTVFHWNGSAWVQQQVLRASDSFPYNNFGEVVDVKGDMAVIGADLQPVNGTPDSGYEGQAYIFRLRGGVWKEEKKLVTADANAQGSSFAGVQSFGYTAVIDDDTALVSATGGSLPGGVYSYSIASNSGCGCSSEFSDQQTIGLLGNDGPRSFQMPWLLGVLLIPFAMSISITVSRKRKKH